MTLRVRTSLTTASFTYGSADIEAALLALRKSLEYVQENLPMTRLAILEDAALRVASRCADHWPDTVAQALRGHCNW